MDGDIRETVIEHLNGDDHFTVYTAERKYITMLERVNGVDGAEIRVRNEDGSVVAHVPVKFISIRKPRFVSEGARERARERFCEWRKNNAESNANKDEEMDEQDE